MIYLLNVIWVTVVYRLINNGSVFFLCVNIDKPSDHVIIMNHVWMLKMSINMLVPLNISQAFLDN